MFAAHCKLDVASHCESALVAGRPSGGAIADWPGRQRRVLPIAARLIEHGAVWKEALGGRIGALDLAPDLAEDIGSVRWFRGLGTLFGLGLAALSFWPDFSSVEAATVLPAGVGVRDEFRSQMIMPLALGGDSGRATGAGALVVPVAHVPDRPTVRLTSMLGRGDTLARMLQRAGARPEDIARVSAIVSAAVPLSEIAPGTRFNITLGRRETTSEPRPIDRLDFRARFDLRLAVERRGDALAVVKHPIAVDTTPLRIRGVVGPSLYRSARAAGAPVKAIQQYLQTLDSHIDLEGDIASADTFDMIVTYKRSANGESEVGTLVYAGLERAGKPLIQLVRWGPDGQFFEASGIGRQQSATTFAPVNGSMTSGYGLRRHPILGYTRMHAGIDFGAAWGSPIFAVGSGFVTYAGRHGGHGNYVRLDHGGGLGTGYGHMSRIAVSPGTRVQAGQVIGYVGSSGLSTGPHLHFEVYEGGRTVNPLSVRFTVRQQVDQKELANFRARLAGLKKVAPGAALKRLVPDRGQAVKLREIERLDN